MIGWLVGWLIGWLIGWLVGWLAELEVTSYFVTKLHNTRQMLAASWGEPEAAL